MSKPKNISDDTPPQKITVEGALDRIGKELGDLSEELHPIWHLEELSDNVGELAMALRSTANAHALSAIVAHGSAKDRAKALNILKGWFDEFRE